MTRRLVDVNVALALVWPRHTGHSAAHAWFAKTGHIGWATNSVVQLGVLRLLTNPAVTQGTVSPEAAIDLLQELTNHPAHEFWPLERPVSNMLSTFAARVRGHSQWTDALLLSQAVQRKGVLVTFDSGLRAFAGSDAADHLLVLKQGSER